MTTEKIDPDNPKHQDPCVCGTYDLCWEFRVVKEARTGTSRFWAYND